MRKEYTPAMLPEYMRVIDCPDSVRELRTKDGIAWKVCFESYNLEVVVQMNGDTSQNGSDCVSLYTVRHEATCGVLEGVKTFWAKDEDARTQEERILYSHARRKAEEVASVRSLGITPLGLKIDTSAIRQMGFFGSKVKMFFSAPVAIHGSKKKPSTSHKVHLYSNSPSAPIFYSPRGRTGYRLEEIAEKLVLIAKI